ncbi:MAG: hypothetical protein QNJ62_06595 [Methyloceanibacter sp.]|nr:hypothetical protein [Methyloceanibacter sp.]
MSTYSKAFGAAGGGAVGIVVTWALQELFGVSVSAEVAAAIATLCGGVATWGAPANKG